jgi:hypothetical protein
VASTTHSTAARIRVNNAWMSPTPRLEGPTTSPRVCLLLLKDVQGFRDR